VFVEPESVEAIVEAIRMLSTDRQRCQEYGVNGRRFVETRYSRQAQARRLAALLEGLGV